jgi:hypothetical protein
MKKEMAPRIPIMLSAFGFPGLGQIVQKRWIPGLLFSAVFLVGFFWVMALAIQNIIELYSMAFSDDWAEPTPVPLTAFVRPLILAGIVYFTSLFDVFLAQQKMTSKKREQELLEEIETEIL